MSKLAGFVLLPVAALFLGACADDHNETEGADSEAMTERVDLLAAELTELTALVTAHGEAVDAAADLAAAQGTEAGYAVGVEGHHEEMHHVMEDMGPCKHDGHGPPLEEMDAALERIEKEVAAHGTAMGAAADVDAARTEETEHQAELESLLGAFRDGHDELAMEGDVFMCPHEGEGAH